MIPVGVLASARLTAIPATVHSTVAVTGSTIDVPSLTSGGLLLISTSGAEIDPDGATATLGSASATPLHYDATTGAWGAGLSTVRSATFWLFPSPDAGSSVAISVPYLGSFQHASGVFLEHLDQVSPLLGTARAGSTSSGVPAGDVSPPGSALAIAALSFRGSGDLTAKHGHMTTLRAFKDPNGVGNSFGIAASYGRPLGWNENVSRYIHTGIALKGA